MERAQVQREPVERNAGRPQPDPETGGEAREVEFVTFIPDEPVDDLAGSEPSERSRRDAHVVHDEDLTRVVLPQPPLPPAARSSRLCTAVAPGRFGGSAFSRAAARCDRIRRRSARNWLASALEIPSCRSP